MRGKFWLKLGIWILGPLLVLYVAFWIVLFNPLEGSVERLDGLIPESVTWAVRGPWGEIRESRLLQKHFLEAPVRDEMEARLELERYLYGPIRDMEEQINASIPDFVGDFSVLEDLMGREVAIAGNLTGPGDDLEEKVMNSPYLLLTRISFKARFMEVLKYEAVRKNVPGLKAYRDFYEYDVGAEAIREGAPEEARYFYFQRVKDVLILSNDRDLMEGAVHFGRAGGLSRQSLYWEYWYYYDTQGPKPSDSALVWLMVDDADRELGGELEGVGRPREGDVTDFLRAFFPVSRTISVTLNPGIGGPDTIPLTGVVRLKSKIEKHLYGLHRTAGEPFGPVLEERGSWLPPDRTFGLVHLKMAPRDFFFAILTSLDQATRDLLAGVSDNGGGADRWDVERLSSQLGDWFEEGVTLSWSRLPEVESIDLDSWEGGSPKPIPALTLMMDVKRNLEPEELVRFFSRNKGQFGFDAPEERPAALGRMFVLRTPTDLRMKLLQPAFALVDRTFFFCTNADELARLLERKAEEQSSLVETPSFREAVSAVSDEGSLFLYADMENARPFLLDQRYEYAFEESFFNEREYRRRVIIDLTRENPGWTNQQRQEAADRALEDRWVEAKRQDFPDAIKRYKLSMIWYEPFRWIALSLNPGGDPGGQIRLDLEGALRLTDED